MTKQEIQNWKDKIDKMSYVELAKLYRFAPIGHPVFSSPNCELSHYFDEKFQAFGGMTTEMSKRIGW